MNATHCVVFVRSPYLVGKVETSNLVRHEDWLKFDESFVTWNIPDEYDADPDPIRGIPLGPIIDVVDLESGEKIEDFAIRFCQQDFGVPLLPQSDLARQLRDSGLLEAVVVLKHFTGKVRGFAMKSRERKRIADFIVANAPHLAGGHLDNAVKWLRTGEEENFLSLLNIVRKQPVLPALYHAAYHIMQGSGRRQVAPEVHAFMQQCFGTPGLARHT